MKDPTTLYKHDGFARQEQEQPGLTPATDPVPDHGEETYVGSAAVSPECAL